MRNVTSDRENLIKCPFARRFLGAHVANLGLSVRVRLEGKHCVIAQKGAHRAPVSPRFVFFLPTFCMIQPHTLWCHPPKVWLDPNRIDSMMNFSHVAPACCRLLLMLLTERASFEGF